MRRRIFVKGLLNKDLRLWVSPLAWALLVCAAFNVCSLGGFFRTTYAIGVPSLIYGFVALLLIGTAETLLVFIPPLSSSNLKHLTNCELRFFPLH